MLRHHQHGTTPMASALFVDVPVPRHAMSSGAFYASFVVHALAVVAEASGGAPVSCKMGITQAGPVTGPTDHIDPGQPETWCWASIARRGRTYARRGLLLVALFCVTRATVPRTLRAWGMDARMWAAHLERVAGALFSNQLQHRPGWTDLGADLGGGGRATDGRPTILYVACTRPDRLPRRHSSSLAASMATLSLRAREPGPDDDEPSKLA